MGNFREKNREGVREMRENSSETTDIGTEMLEQADKINALLESITLQDSEDIQAIDHAGSEYQQSFDGAFSEQVETAGREIEGQYEEINQTVGAELENVRTGIRTLEQAGGVSEIGRSAAETGRAKLENGAGEYEDIRSDAEGVSDETQRKIEALKSNLGRIFG